MQQTDASIAHPQAGRNALVDVLVPVYNARDTVEEALASIQAQTVRDIRILVVDDGSTDGTGEILVRMAAADSRIEVLTIPNGGIVGALNAGLAHCTADLVARHDGDDLAFPDRFAKQIAYLDANPDCIAVASNVWHIDERGARMGGGSDYHGTVAPDATSYPSVEPYLIHPFLMVRRGDIQEAGGYRHAFHSEDTDLYWRLLNRGRLFNLSERLGSYRIHPNSISSNSVVNGRIAAVNAQLAAISYRRREAGKEDIRFPEERLATYKDAATLERICEAASVDLDEDEKSYLRMATAAKLLSLLKFRPYLPDAADCAFIRETFRAHSGRMDARNAGLVKYLIGSLALRLVAKGRWRELSALSPSAESLARLVVSDAKAALGMKKQAVQAA